MKTQTATITAGELARGFRDAGLGRGDIVFLHLCLDALAPFESCTSAEETTECLTGALRDVIGEEGTILVPTYTFSFCRQEVFDVQNTPTMGGPWSTSADILECFRKLPGAVRSGDPIHSVAGLGPAASLLLKGIAHTCFGEDSVHHRLRKAGGKICTLGVELGEATFRHHAEESTGVPYRYQKLFTGYVRDGGAARKEGWTYYVRILAPNAFPDGTRLERVARDTGVCRAAAIGPGEVLVVDAQEYFDLTIEQLSRDRWFTARGPAADPVELERARVDGRTHEVELPEGASMEEMVEAIWTLPRDIVSDGYDAALTALAKQVPMAIHEYPSGTECWSWILPEKWTCHEAYLETLDGRRLFSYADNPLHVVSYSLPFEGIVSRSELLAHLHTHPWLPNAIPFIFKYYEKDWGLCCSQELKDSLNQEQYRVVIRTAFSFGTLKVGEVVAPGRSEDTIVLCAHLCHPAMANDDLTGVVVGIDVMRALLKRSDLRYTYRLLIVPETIGSIAHLSRHQDQVSRMKGGVFLEMLGRDLPHCLQKSFAGDTGFDACFGMALEKQDRANWVCEYRESVGNDERQFNGPGVRVPMLSLARVLPPGAPGSPYLEYHSSLDTAARISSRALQSSRDLVLAMLDMAERNVTPVNRFKGEVFCSRYGIHIDAYTNPEGNRAMFRIMDLIDGTSSVAAIAGKLGISFDAVHGIVTELARHGLVAW